MYRDFRPAIVRTVAAAAALVAAVVVLVAAPYPPYWDSGNAAAIHHAPVAWPNEAGWTAYTSDAVSIADKRQSDPSNGGTSPQGYVNVSSGCTDETQPSVYYAYNSAAQVLYFRWRVQSPPHNYATGPSAGSFSSSSPWSSALFTVFMDTNGDGFRDFAVHIDGSCHRRRERQRPRHGARAGGAKRHRGEPYGHVDDRRPCDRDPAGTGQRHVRDRRARSWVDVHRWHLEAQPRAAASARPDAECRPGLQEPEARGRLGLHHRRRVGAAGPSAGAVGEPRDRRSDGHLDTAALRRLGARPRLGLHRERRLGPAQPPAGD